MTLDAIRIVETTSDFQVVGGKNSLRAVVTVLIYILVAKFKSKVSSEKLSSVLKDMEIAF